MTNSMHECPYPTCSRKVGFTQLACKAHRFVVTRQTRAWVWDAYRSGDFEEHGKAVAQATAEMRRHHELSAEAGARAKASAAAKPKPKSKPEPQTAVTSDARTCAECGAKALVGFGTPARWLCQAHFDEAMARVGQVTRMVKDVAEGRG